MKTKKPKCLSCKKTINNIAIEVNGKPTCVDCYNEAMRRGFIARPAFKN